MFQGRDSYDNKGLFTFNKGLGQQLEWAVMANSSLPPAGTPLQNSIVKHGGHAVYTRLYLSGGGHHVNYTATKSERYNIRGRMSSGGIFGTHFVHEDLSNHATSPVWSLSSVDIYKRLDSQINFNWGLGRPIGTVTNCTAFDLDSVILQLNDTETPCDQVTLDHHTASAISETLRLLINCKERTITSCSPASNVETAGAASSTDAIKSILHLSSSASSADPFYLDWSAKVFNVSDNSFETQLITKYEGSTTTASLCMVADTSNSKEIGLDKLSAKREGMVEQFEFNCNELFSTIAVAAAAILMGTTM